jgi:N-methylhydantoinase B
VHVPEGTTLRMINAAGGGYGSPLERDTWRVLDDVRNELVSRTGAREHYGVVLVEDRLEVDETATTELRAELARGHRPKIEGWRDQAWFEEVPA